MARFRGVPRFLALSGIAAFLLATAPGEVLAKSELAKWSDGPIRYIAQKDELKTFKKLKKDTDRALFIDRFWARRDPTPETLQNEYRQIFWERVKGANDLFLDSAGPGWKTDRGKIYILYGPPTKIEEDLHVQTGGSASAGQGLIRWLYEGRPEQRTDLDAVTVVAFVRNLGGEYRVSYDPLLSSIFFDVNAFEDPRERAIDRYLNSRGVGKSELSVMLDLGKMQEVPPHALVVMERVETVESYETYELKVNLSRYLHPDELDVIAVVTVDVSDSSEKVSPSVIARFADADDPGRQPKMLGEDAFRVDSVDGKRVAQARLELRPGRYEVTVVVVDPETAATGMQRLSLAVPERSADLRLSDLLWADRLEPLPYASLASHDEPFHVGPYRVLPRMSSDFQAGETLRVFYEIYGGRPPYRVSYRIEGRELDGSWTALGQPSTAEQTTPSQGWEMPTTAAWPAGDYRVKIAVDDGLDGRVEAQLPFRLDAGQPTDPTN